MFNLLFLTFLSIVNASSLESNLSTTPPISKECIQTLANIIDIQPGQTKSIDFRSNNQNVSCNTKIYYDGKSLTFDFGIKNKNMNNLSLLPNLKTTNKYFYESYCQMDPNSSIGSYSNNIGFTKHYRGLDEETGQFYGQESLFIQVARLKNSKLSFHFVVANNRFLDQDQLLEATCWPQEQEVRNRAHQ